MGRQCLSQRRLGISAIAPGAQRFISRRSAAVHARPSLDPEQYDVAARAAPIRAAHGQERQRLGRSWRRRGITIMQTRCSARCTWLGRRRRYRSVTQISVCSRHRAIAASLAPAISAARRRTRPTSPPAVALAVAATAAVFVGERSEACIPTKPASSAIT